MKNCFLIACLLANATLFNAQIIGLLDPAFGSGGFVKYDLNNTDNGLRAVVVQPDGKIVASGYTGYDGGRDAAVLRLHPNGTLDNSFGSGGIARIDFLGLDNGSRGLVLQPDNKIIIVGSTYTLWGDLDFGVARYLPDGSPDGSFGVNGLVTTDLQSSSQHDESFAAVLQPDKKIVVGGRSVGLDMNWDFGLVRYLPNGDIDSTFGINGIVVANLSGADDELYNLALQPDGKIVAAGYSNSPLMNNDIAVARFNPDGSLDDTFGQNGVVFTDMGKNFETANSVRLLQNSKILVGGYTSTTSSSGDDDFLLAQYHPDGSLDLDFGSNGVVVTAFGPYIDRASALLVLDDDKIFAGGWTALNTAGDSDFALARYLKDGSMDQSFGSGGLATFSLGYAEERLTRAVLQADGKIVGIGDVRNTNGNWDFTVVRLQKNLLGLDGPEPPFLDARLKPNLTAHSSVLEYTIGKEIEFSVQLFDSQGKMICVLAPAVRQVAGEYRRELNMPVGLPAGEYFVVLATPAGNHSLKLIKN